MRTSSGRAAWIAGGLLAVGGCFTIAFVVLREVVQYRDTILAAARVPDFAECLSISWSLGLWLTMACLIAWFLMSTRRLGGVSGATAKNPQSATWIRD